jgi:hypothetical protein
MNHPAAECVPKVATFQSDEGCNPVNETPMKGEVVSETDPPHLRLAY